MSLQSGNSNPSVRGVDSSDFSIKLRRAVFQKKPASFRFIHIDGAKKTGETKSMHFFMPRSEVVLDFSASALAGNAVFRAFEKTLKNKLFWNFLRQPAL